MLLDRMLVVRLPELTVADRLSIVSAHILPRIGKVHDGAMPVVVDLVCDAKPGEGMRGIEKVLERAAMHASVRLVRGAAVVPPAVPPAVELLTIEKGDLERAIKLERGADDSRYMSMYA